MEIISRNMDTDGRRMEIISRIWIKTIEGDHIRNMDTDGRRRLYQKYAYRS